MADAWDTFYRWEWFRREQWRPGFREAKAGKWGGSSRAFKKILDERGGGLALDSSCGLGLKTIVMAEMGVRIVGCDGCAFAVEKAQELAQAEGHEIEYFVSRWAELPERAGQRFDAVFNDALSWIVTRGEFEAALTGLLGVLRAGGVLVFRGAEEGSPSDPASRAAFFEDFWRRQPRFAVEWSHEAGGTRCTSIRVREKGEQFVDEHHLFLIEEGGRPRLEVATIRQPAWWHWAVLAEMFAEAGFSRLATRRFPGMGRGGTDFALNVATK